MPSLAIYLYFFFIRLYHYKYEHSQIELEPSTSIYYVTFLSFETPHVSRQRGIPAA